MLWLPKYPPGAVNNLMTYAESLGLERGRIIFCNPTLSKEEYARKMQLADVALDSNLFNGHTTGMDILWAGTPMISLPGYFSELFFHTGSLLFKKYKYFYLYCVQEKLWFLELAHLSSLPSDALNLSLLVSKTTKILRSS